MNLYQEVALSFKKVGDLWLRGWALSQVTSQNDPKTTSLTTSLTKNSQPPTKKFFFECRLEDWPIRLSPWTAL